MNNISDFYIQLEAEHFPAIFYNIMKDKKSKESSIVKALSVLLLLISTIFASNCFAGDVSYYIYDSPGRSVVSIINGSQNVINNYRYSDFGDVISEIENKHNVYKYSGEQNEPETGLIFLRQRCYDPKIGRFITKDPHPGALQNSQSLNPYPYCANNPVNLKDPNGDEPVTLSVIGAYLLYVGVSGLFSGGTDALIEETGAILQGDTLQD